LRFFLFFVSFSLVLFHVAAKQIITNLVI
jgi:hypothetical protein